MEKGLEAAVGKAVSGSSGSPLNPVSTKRKQLLDTKPVIGLGDRAGVVEDGAQA